MSGAQGQSQPVSPQQLLLQALSLRTRVASALARAASAGLDRPPPPPSREGLLQQVLALRDQAARARASAEAAARTQLQLEVLAEASELIERYDAIRGAYDQAIAVAARQMLLRQLVDLKKDVAAALARVRLIPDVITV